VVRPYCDAPFLFLEEKEMKTSALAKIVCLILLALSLVVLSACDKTGHNHNLGNWYEVSDATCTEGGVERRDCESQICNYYETRDTDSLGHAEITHEAKKPTCTEIGWDAYVTCSRCDYNTKVEKGTTAHNYVNRVCSSCGDILYSEGLAFTSNGDGTCYVSGIGTCNDAKIVIPYTSPDGDSITSIGDRAFSSCGSLTSIEIPASVTSIGSVAFFGCCNLTSIEIPSSVTSIGDDAFSYCDSLTSVSFGENSQLTSIGDDAFSYCDSLTSVSFGENSQLTSIGDDAFYFCRSLTSIEIPASVTSIGSFAFHNCDSLTSVSFGENSQLTSIGSFAFYFCYSLTSVSFGENSQLTSIGSDAFLYCISLTSVSFGDNSQLTSIGEDAFRSCRSLTSIEIPSSVTSIGSSAFSDCYKLVEVINKSSLNITKGSSNSGYVAYYALEVHNGESKMVNIDDYLFYTYEGVNYLVNYVGNDTELVLPESYNGETYVINKYAFYYCYSLTSIEIPSSVTSIGDSAFYYCRSLTSIEISASVTRIGSDAFIDCDSLTDVYYGGTEEEWNAISIDWTDSSLTNATIHFTEE